VTDGIEGRVVADGSVPSALHALARSEKAALLAVGATHRGPVGRLIPGGIAERLVHGSPCAVLVVPQTDAAAPLETIGVAYDGRAESRRALRTAAALATRIGASLRLISVLDLWPAGIDLPRGVDEVHEVWETRMTEVLEQAATGLRRRGLDVETESVVAAAGPGVVRCCEEEGVDLLVAGSRGYGPIRSVMVGGASRHILDHAPCPVLVIPRSTKVTLLSSISVHSQRQSVV
jgi:nucleotide-binding universal stress UspA family protein